MKRFVIPICVLCLILTFGSAACNFKDRNRNNVDNKGLSVHDADGDNRDTADIVEDEVVYLPYEIDNTGRIQRFYANESNSVDVVIPSTYSIDGNGRLITGTAYDVKAIGTHCFANNNLIESVYIPDTVVSIGERAFYNCANLATVNVNKTVESIGADVFESCPKLNSVTRNGKSGIIIEENNNLSSFAIPDSVLKIEDDSFANWTRLNSISTGTNVKHIGDNAFSHCENLGRVSINSSLDYLGDNAFSQCENLERVSINSSLNNLGKDVFADCEKLTTLTTSGKSDKGNSIYFAPNQPIRSFVVPLSVTSIQDGFFYGWKQLEKLNIHKAIAYPGMILKDNENLTELTCGNGEILSLFYRHSEYEPKIESRKMYTVDYFGDCYYIPNTLTEVHLLNNVGTFCLYNMKSVKKVYIPSTVSNFGDSAFFGCSGLTNVYFSTNSDWEYNMSYEGEHDSGRISKADMNNSVQLAKQLKAHNGFEYRWSKLCN